MRLQNVLINAEKTLSVASVRSTRRGSKIFLLCGGINIEALLLFNCWENLLFEYKAG
jgi:hypothetical protein